MMERNTEPSCQGSTIPAVCFSYDLTLAPAWEDGKGGGEPDGAHNDTAP